jgi:hypothetical protein
MPDDASSDWLDIVRTQAQGIRASFLTVALFVLVIAITMLGQLRQLTSDLQQEKSTACVLPPDLDSQKLKSDNRSPDCPLAADWDTLQAAYEQVPVQPMDQELIPWNKFAIEATLIATFVEGTDPKSLENSTSPTARLALLFIDSSKETPVAPGTTAKISHFYLHLKDFNANFKSIEWAAVAKIPFNDLDRDKLIALTNAYDFNIDSMDKQGEDLAQTVVNRTFLRRLDQLRPKVVDPISKKPIVEEGFVDVLTTGASLDAFKTLRGQLTVNDLATFQSSFEAAEAGRLIKFLQSTPFTSLGAAKNEDARLRKQIQDIRDGNTDSTVTIPFLNLPVTLSVFSWLSGFLNFVLLAWVFWQEEQMIFALNRYRALVPGNTSKLEAALTGIPGRGRWTILARAGLAACLTLPAVLGASLLFLPLFVDNTAHSSHASYMYLALPVMVYAIALALVRSLQVAKFRALAGGPLPRLDNRTHC